MRIKWSIGRQLMTVYTDVDVWTAKLSSVVRNDLNGWRPNKNKSPASEVVHAISKENTETNTPVMPKPFPKGEWEITGVEFRTDKYREPLVIKTNAYQLLDIWELGPDGGYLRKTPNKINDYQYYLHCSASNTTQGCGNFHDNKQALYRLATEVLMEKIKNKKVTILVED